MVKLADRHDSHDSHDSHSHSHESNDSRSPILASKLPPPRPPMTTLRCDLHEYARVHTGPQSWSADERVTGREALAAR